MIKRVYVMMMMINIKTRVVVVRRCIINISNAFVAIIKIKSVNKFCWFNHPKMHRIAIYVGTKNLMKIVITKLKQLYCLCLVFVIFVVITRMF